MRPPSVYANPTCPAGCPCDLLHLLHGPHRIGCRLLMILLSRQGWTATQIAGRTIMSSGVTGPVPAEYDQSQIIGKDIVWVELFTVLAIALIVGVRFSSAGAPLATLACAATAYVIAIRVVVWLAGRMGVTLPPDLDPVLVVLLLGVTTDYTVFFLDGMRAQVAGGVPRIRAARLATAQFAPIILAAGIIVAAAAASLVVARTKMLGAASFAMLAVIPLEQFRQIALAMALGVVLDAIAVRSLLVPALVALFGRLGMWPGNRRARPEPVPAAPPPVPAGDQP
jgi:RND superfamily putative drug exporter